MEKSIEKKVNQFFSGFKFLKFKKGEIIIQAGATPSGIFYLVKGIVKQYSISKEGDELTLNVFRPPSFFPMMWAISGIDNRYYFEAATPTEIWRAPKKEVILFLKREPEVLYDLTNRLFVGMSGLLTRMEYLMSGNAYLKTIIVLLIFAKRFGRKKSLTHIIIPIRLTHKDIASYAGVSRETVSRELKMMEKKKLLSYRGNILVINDIRKLEEEFAPFQSPSSMV